ncbi:MAG: M20/M25/M40 family metallo-hydrolase, partial [Gemmatimonadota bacterium]
MSRSTVAPLTALAALLAAFPFLAGAPAAAQTPIAVAAGTTASASDAAWDSAYFAWDAGDYPDALERMERLLGGPDAARYLERAALLTGELYRTAELTTDGAAPRWSPDGRYAAYETTRSGNEVTVVVEPAADGVREVAVLSGSGAVLGAGGRVAWMVVDETPELAAARAENERLRQAGDASWRQQRGEIARLEAAATRVMERTLPGGEARDVTPRGAAPVSLEYDDAALQILEGTDPNERGLVTSADGATVAYLMEAGEETEIHLAPAASPDAGSAVYSTANRVSGLAISPSGRRVAFQEMPREDWEIMVVGEDGQAVQVTTDIQHDLYPAFLSEDRLLTIKGEGRHRRSFLQDLTTGTETRLFHNNTVRTVAPEYQWAPSPDGTKLLIQAERDGDTVSPERGVYFMDLGARVSLEEVRERVRTALNEERALRAWGERRFAENAAAVRDAVADVSTGRIFHYAEDLHRFGSKNITQPGNIPATHYLADRLRAFGYEPELQWFEARGLRVANVIARLPGTAHPDVVYAVSSHFDSSSRGPGADDNSSGTTALLEAARVMKDRPQEATIEFAFFTGEESGLLGGREYVRQALESGKGLVGALNNDMVGFANNHRLDNTIRYSNPGIRDVQHAAAFLFTDLITYDALYYKSTDAQAYYDAYGDIVGGIGSYPILASPHYHQSHDVLETINQQLVAEVSRTTVATLMLLASVPSRVKELEVVSASGGMAQVRWEALPESDLRNYVVVVDGGARPDPATGQRVSGTSATVQGVRPGSEIAVIAVDADGRPGWDW